MTKKLEQQRKINLAEKTKLEMYMRLILMNYPSPILLFDGQGKLAYASDSYFQYCKAFQADEIVGYNLHELLTPVVSEQSLNEIERLYKNVFSEKHTFETGQDIVLGNQEAYDHFKIEIIPMLDTGRNIEGILVIFFDITESINARREAEQARELAEQSSQAKTNFLAKMSHEIRTPMNAIIGISEIQLQNKSLPKDSQEAMNKIINSGYLLLGIINDILDLSKIEAGKLELASIAYNVSSLVNDTVNLNALRYGGKPVEFRLQVDENIPSMLYGDELRIKQILNNLLSNAFKYTDEGEVSMSITAEYVQPRVTLVFRITDTGRGMSAEQVDKLFDEYTRFNMEANRTTEGAGLGMNITKHLVCMMNGEIFVESEPGKGSVFTVRLPQEIVGSEVIDKEAAENLEQFRVGSLSQNKKTPEIMHEYMPYGKVLIVDDVETNRYVARGLMAPYGLSIETAASGFEAVDKIKSGATFDIIFMDHFMPKMDGMETVKIIRGLGYTYPIIALTANALMGQAEIYMENGFDGFISKPIDIRQLDISLNKLVRDQYPPETIEAARRLAAKLSKPDEQPPSDQELAAIFVRDAEKVFHRISAIHKNAYRRSDDIRAFVIDVHAMKSALANIGETMLSDAAFKLEQAGRAEDNAVMLTKTPVFLEELQKVIEKNKPKEAAPEAEQDEDRVYLREKLHIIQKACEDYDEITANAALAELKQKNWRSVKVLLDTISEYLLHSDFEETVKLAKEYTIKVSEEKR